jgi:hypothetical protein
MFAEKQGGHSVMGVDRGRGRKEDMRSNSQELGQRVPGRLE